MIHSSVRALLSQVIDYAGMFPPASLDLKAAAQNYESYQAGDHGWMLGRFVVPASSVKEIKGISPFTALVDGADLNAANQPGVENIELKASTPAQIRSVAAALPSGALAYFEIPLAQDPRKCIEAISEVGARAKVRTGGLTVDAFPGSRDLGRFIEACVEQGVAFKATAGLHHAIRGEHRITPARGSASAVMHGFLNVFLAAAFARAGMAIGEVVRLLEDQSPGAFTFEPDSVTWREESLDTEQIEDARTNLAISFGSCCFTDAIAELTALHLL